MNDFRTEDPRKARFLELLHERLDGPMDADRRAELDRLIDESAEVRAYAEEQISIQEQMRRLAPIRMPEGDLEEVWAQTISAKRSSVRWRAVGLAAMLLLAVGLFVLLQPPQSTTNDDGAIPPDVAQAMSELRMVFEITDTAVRRSEKATVDGLRDSIAPALESTPISKWIPNLSQPTSARSDGRVQR